MREVPNVGSSHAERMGLCGEDIKTTGGARASQRAECEVARVRLSVVWAAPAPARLREPVRRNCSNGARRKRASRAPVHLRAVASLGNISAKFGPSGYAPSCQGIGGI